MVDFAETMMGMKRYCSSMVPGGASPVSQKNRKFSPTAITTAYPPSLLQKESVIFPTARRESTPVSSPFICKSHAWCSEKSANQRFPPRKIRPMGGGKEERILTHVRPLVGTGTCVDSDDRFLLRNIALVINGNFFFFKKKDGGNGRRLLSGKLR